jgi:hypothetical protein
MVMHMLISSYLNLYEDKYKNVQRRGFLDLHVDNWMIPSTGTLLVQCHKVCTAFHCFSQVICECHTLIFRPHLHVSLPHTVHKISFFSCIICYFQNTLVLSQLCLCLGSSLRTSCFMNFCSTQMRYFLPSVLQRKLSTRSCEL